MAIALDTSKDLSTTTGTSLTVSYTNNGNLLLVAVQGGFTDIMSGVTYAGVAMTQVAVVQMPTDRFIYLYKLLNPATGANNIVITFTASTFIRAVAASYTGANGGVNVSGTTTVSAGTSITKSLTSIDDNSWGFLYVNTDNQAPVAGTGSTLRQLDGVTAIYDSNGVIHPAGSYSMSATFSSSDAAAIMAIISPTATAASTNASFLLNFV